MSKKCDHCETTAVLIRSTGLKNDELRKALVSAQEKQSQRYQHITRLQGMVNKYGKHKRSCQLSKWRLFAKRRLCTCGLDESFSLFFKEG